MGISSYIFLFIKKIFNKFYALKN
jgi:Na+-driven multidrug efflux pump